MIIILAKEIAPIQTDPPAQVPIQPAQPAQPQKPEPEKREEQPAYCTGLSINTDFYWDRGSDVRFMEAANKGVLIGVLQEAATAGHMKIVDTRVTLYGPNPKFGFSYLVVLGQSHIMIHTWPEQFFMNVDIFTCGSEGDPALILQFLQSKLRPHGVRKNQVRRGVRKDIEDANETPDSPANLKPV